ncbi:MAG: hypothetical protein EKK51_14225 [Mycolicibacterium sp.]|uniref:hypothetical protein n=1 Tax=Mycolicibacterium sp. TaxID=2320850 RepID=UPI00092608BD|nr:hypothetical protein [Mycolicibacterium sp.]RUP31524.1 MAG: hypothetical protein EKK51_14225 [Mycolicibacterium sp.]SHU10740.1 Uncharacterised protein [Mycobacteroides abscessus subsp. abscessus]
MKSIVEFSQEADAIPPESLAAGVLRAQLSTLCLRDVEHLRQAAIALIDAAATLDCRHLVAANAAAEPLTTAAALLSNGKLAYSDCRNSSAKKVLVVDAATVTGNVTRSCASYLRENGASWVGAIIFDRVRPDLDGLDDDPGIDYVASLDLTSY